MSAGIDANDGSGRRAASGMAGREVRRIGTGEATEGRTAAGGTDEAAAGGAGETAEALGLDAEDLKTSTLL